MRYSQTTQALTRLAQVLLRVLLRVFVPGFVPALALALGAAAGAARAAPDDTADGPGAHYQQRCARCHDGGMERAPARSALQLLSADRVRAALVKGSMREQAAGLANADLDALAGWLGGAPAPAAQAGARCAAATGWPADAFSRPHWTGWGAGAAQQRYQGEAMARLAGADVPKLALKWAFGFPDVVRAYSQPAIAGGRLFVGSAAGKVYALDARSGCTHWEFSAKAPVRTAISVGPRGDGGAALYFGDQRGTVYALDAVTGQAIWRSRVDSHPTALITGAPLLVGRKLLVPVASFEEAAAMNPAYACCSFRGSVVALDADTSSRSWQAYTVDTAAAATRKNEREVQLLGPSGASVWLSPTVDLGQGLVFMTTGNSYSDPPSSGANAILAVRLDDGGRVWQRQMTAQDAYTTACETAPAGSGNCPQAKGPDLDFGASAMLVNLGGGRRALIAGQKSGEVHALDPDHDGQILWQTKVGSGGKLGGVQWGTAADERHAYIAVSDVRIAPVASFMAGAQASPFGVHLRVDPEAGGGLVALKLDTGAVAWRTPHPGCGGKPGCSPAQSAAVTVIPGVVFSGGLDGHLRAYDAGSGRIVWDVDTARPFATVNGVAGRGGSLDGPGAVVVDGMLYVNSGYAIFGGKPGNVLLAFSVDGQ